VSRDSGVRAEIDRIYREEYGRVVASLARRFGGIDIAEDAAGEALLVAVERWPVDDIPPNPGGWLTTTAGNRAIDRIRRESLRDTKHQAALMINDDTPHEPTGPVEDDGLRLVFTCCHPATAREFHRRGDRSLIPRGREGFKNDEKHRCCAAVTRVSSATAFSKESSTPPLVVQ
jgi:RNA polymerase sigma-70 factor (ECF subfamily)